eukprot:1154236-Pelagomonas_calceolata.AAC.6
MLDRVFPVLQTVCIPDVLDCENIQCDRCSAKWPMERLFMPGMQEMLCKFWSPQQDLWEEVARMCFTNANWVHECYCAAQVGAHRQRRWHVRKCNGAAFEAEPGQPGKGPSFGEACTGGSC